MPGRPAEILDHLLHEDLAQQHGWLGGVHLPPEALGLRYEGQCQHAGVVGDEDGVNVSEVEQFRLRWDDLGLAVHKDRPTGISQLRPHQLRVVKRRADVGLLNNWK